MLPSESAAWIAYLYVPGVVGTPASGWHAFQWLIRSRLGVQP